MDVLTVPSVLSLLKTGCQRLLGGKQVPHNDHYCLLPSVDTAKSRHSASLQLVARAHGDRPESHRVYRKLLLAS